MNDVPEYSEIEQSGGNLILETERLLAEYISICFAKQSSFWFFGQKVFLLGSF